jgi:hypothetical protein
MDALGPRGRSSRLRRCTPTSMRIHACVRADAPIYPRGYFITDATVRPTHKRPSGHRLSVCPSSIVRVTTLFLHKTQQGPRIQCECSYVTDFNVLAARFRS